MTSSDGGVINDEEACSSGLEECTQIPGHTQLLQMHYRYSAGVPNQSSHSTNRVAWVHIPKCGSSFGTTVVHFANSSLPATAVYGPEDRNLTRDEALYFDFSGTFIEDWPEEQYFQGGLLWGGHQGKFGGHHGVMQEDFQQWRGRFVALFREPAARMQSAFLYMKELGWNDMQVGRFCAENKYEQTLMLTGQADGWQGSRIARDSPNTTLALERLKGFMFVGITEEYDLSICLFHAMFGGQPLRAEFENVRPTLSDIHQEANPFEGCDDEADRLLHREVNKTFWSRVAEYNVTRESCQAVIDSL